MNKVKKAVLSSGTIYRGVNYVVGVSGGPDSLCLLDVMVKIADETGIGIIPVHVNHKLRPESDAEQKHVEEICKGYELECNSFEVDCKKVAEEMKISVEEAGRYVRYDIFTQVAEKLAQSLAEKEIDDSRRLVMIATAHNADDQSETVIHRMIRGTGLHGIVGMKAIREDDSGYFVVKPLLEVPRADIEAYIEREKLKANIDASNFETDATRNKIRLELIPYIEENINPNIKESLRRFALSASIDDDYLEQISNAVYQDVTELNTVNDSIILKIDKLQNYHVAIIRRVVAAVLRDFGMDQDLTLNHINGVMEVMFSENPSAHLDLPGGIVCDRKYLELMFRIKDMHGDDEREQAELVISSEMRLIPMIIDASEYSEKRDGLFAAFDYDKFCENYPDSLSNIAVRNRKEGDFIAMSGGKRKKLQDFFVDSKVPKALRDTIPVVAIGSEILWITPHDSFATRGEREKGKFSQNYQISNKTKEVLFLELVRPV